MTDIIAMHRADLVDAVTAAVTPIKAELAATKNALAIVQDVSLAHAGRQNDRIRDLEALLRELTDIEGPQPGHVEWYRRVQAALGAQSETPVEQPVPAFPLVATPEGDQGPQCKRHDWSYEQYQPWKRTCLRCGRKEVWGGSTGDAQ